MNKAYLFPLAAVSVLAFFEHEAYAYPPIGDPSCGQIGQPVCLFGTLEWGVAGNFGCDRGLKENGSFCVNDLRETIPVDNWPAKALRLQRELQADLKLHQLTVINSHNAYNNWNDGYRVPLAWNQGHSITDQLRMGVRSLSLDVHWVDSLVDTAITPDALRLCHSSGPTMAEHAMLCTHFERPFHQIIEELNQWMRRPENSNEVVFLDMELYVDGRDNDLKEVIMKHLGDLWLSPTEFENLKIGTGAGAIWPTLNEIRATRKRLVGFVGYLNDDLKKVFNQTFKDENDGLQGAKYFVPATCSFDDWLTPAPPISMYPKILTDNVRFGVTEDTTLGLVGPLATGVIIFDTLKQLTKCNVTGISLDQITREKIQNAVWSWDMGQPDNPNDEHCTEMWGNGRWNNLRCHETRPYACYSKNDNAWKITPAAGPWTGGITECKAFGNDYAYDVPRDGYQNNALHTVVGDRRVWLNLNDLALKETWKSWTSSDVVNLARNMPASQSSLYTQSLYGGATNAVDGNTDGHYLNGSVTHTNDEYQPWWQVDLQGSQHIDSVVLFNRTDCCIGRLSNFKVKVSNDGTNWETKSEHPGWVTGKAIFPINDAARYVRVELNGQGILSLAEVQVLGKNLALMKPTDQSPTYTQSIYGGSRNAVDGITDGAYLNGSVTHTNEVENAWWRVDLGTSQYIRTVRLYNRTDCCNERLSNFKVLISDDGTTWEPKYEHAGTVVGKAIIPIGHAARYVKVQLNGKGTLSLAEVMVLP